MHEGINSSVTKANNLHYQIYNSIIEEINNSEN